MGEASDLGECVSLCMHYLYVHDTPTKPAPFTHLQPRALGGGRRHQVQQRGQVRQEVDPAARAPLPLGLEQGAVVAVAGGQLQPRQQLEGEGQRPEGPAGAAGLLGLFVCSFFGGLGWCVVVWVKI